jgi:hypothetical protein
MKGQWRRKHFGANQATFHLRCLPERVAGFDDANLPRLRVVADAAGSLGLFGRSPDSPPSSGAQLAGSSAHSTSG